jgi:hypothetical protein
MDKIIGFRAYHHGENRYLHFDHRTGRNYLDASKPEPIARSDAHRRIAAFLDQPGHEHDDDFSIDPIFATSA